MIGIIPSGNKTFEVIGPFCNDMILNKLYYDKNNRLYIYSNIYNRPNPDTGYFPVYDGKNKYDSKFAVVKYYPNDIINISLSDISNNITKDIADKIKHDIRRADNNTLHFDISDNDNMFTQCIKGSINQLNLTQLDLIDLSKFHEKQIDNYCISLNKISFMRTSRWKVWIDLILHLNYILNIYKDNNRIIQYRYPSEELISNIKIIKCKDSLKQIVRMLINHYNINKDNLRNNNIDDYTINNLFTALNNEVEFSAQLFTRFLRMNKFNYEIDVYKNDTLIFEFKE